jgi:hypothetical protein
VIGAVVLTLACLVNETRGMARGPIGWPCTVIRSRRSSARLLLAAWTIGRLSRCSDLALIWIRPGSSGADECKPERVVQPPETDS